MSDSTEADLCAPYVPCLIRFDDPPRLEYVKADMPTISRRVDERFDVLLDLATREPVGFRYWLRG